MSRRNWGKIKKQPTKTSSFQASFVGPDGRRHYAPHTFASQTFAQGWLAQERAYKDGCTLTGERWKTPAERAVIKQAEVLRFGDYGKRVMDQRILRPRTRIGYEEKWNNLIEPVLGKLAVQDLTPTVVRNWFSGLDSKLATRNGHAYSLLNMICNTAIKDGLLDRNPCQIVGAMNPKPTRRVEIPSTVELHAIADKLATDDRYDRFKVLVLLAGWCGMRFGEVSELRRKDFNADCSTVTISRAVTHRRGDDGKWCRIDATKTGDARTVAIPPHIREDVKAHLAQFVDKKPEALLFEPARGGCHLNDRVFNKDVFQKAAKDVGREDLSAHDLRRFAGTQNATVSTLAENMARLGHKTVSAAMRYQQSVSGRDAEIAAALSVNALAELAENQVETATVVRTMPA